MGINIEMRKLLEKANRGDKVVFHDGAVGIVIDGIGVESEFCVDNKAVLVTKKPSGELYLEIARGYLDYTSAKLYRRKLAGFNKSAVSGFVFTDDIKVHVPTSEISAKVQKAAFKQGFAWPGRQQEVMNSEQPYLFFDKIDKTITFARSDQADYFARKRSIEVSPETILRE